MTREGNVRVTGGTDVDPEVLATVPLPNAPEVLAGKSADVLRGFEYSDAPVDVGYSFRVDEGYWRYAQSRRDANALREEIQHGSPPLIRFWYRQSPRPLRDQQGRVSWDDPLSVEAGMAAVEVDATSRLLRFEVVPVETDESAARSPTIDWRPLFTSAGLEAERFTPAEPKALPLTVFDAQVAWTGSYPHAPQLPLRVEAASWHGRPVYFRIIMPWETSERA